MYAFRFYAHKDGNDTESGTHKTNNLLEYLHRVDGIDSPDYAARSEIERGINNDPEFGPDLLSPFGYSNDAVRLQQAPLDGSTKSVADYMDKERRQSHADYSGKTTDTMDMYYAPHRGISVLGINDPRYSIYDPTAMHSGSSLDTYASQEDLQKRAADFMHKNFKVDPDEVWSDTNLKDVYYDCSEPIYQAFCTTKLKPSVFKGAKGHFE